MKLSSSLPLIAAAALVAGLQTGTAGAQDDASAPLSPQQRVALIKAAQADAGATAGSLGLGDREKLLVADVVKDTDGTVHTRYERTFAGLPVLGGDLITHQRSGRQSSSVTKATGATISVPSTTPEKGAAFARTHALKAASAAGDSRSTAKAPRLVVWAASGRPVLAWEAVATGLQRDGSPSELHVISDANRGTELFRYQAVRHGSGNSNYSGRVTVDTTQNASTRLYELIDPKRGNHRTCDMRGATSGSCATFTDPDDSWDDQRQRAGVDAHYGHAMTWDYYKAVHGRNGIRGDGRGSTSRVHYGNNYANAFWQDSCFCMTYGDGQGNAKPLTSIDVAAHEMTHGVTSATAKLVYSGESGGLNEGTSDIFAATTEFYTNNPNDVGDYLVGEKVDLFGNGRPLRYMDKPSKDGRSKDSWYSGIGSIDVHYSSGVANHFFYLLSEGSGPKVINGVSYDSPTYNNQPVTGIGRAAAEKIWYRALTVYMTSNTNYKAARTATLNAARDLYGQGSANYNATAAAWTGVNVT